MLSANNHGCPPRRIRSAVAVTRTRSRGATAGPNDCMGRDNALPRIHRHPLCGLACPDRSQPETNHRLQRGCGECRAAIFAFTLSSILMSGGQGRLKPSPRSFFVASMPSLLPMAVLAGGVVEHVGRAFGEDAVALRVGVGAEAEEDFAGVVHVWWPCASTRR